MLVERGKKLVQKMPADFEAALIQTDANRFYMLNIETGDAGTLLVLPQRLVYIIDSRYIEVAGEEVKHAEIVLEENMLAQVDEILRKEGVHRLYVEDGISVQMLGRIKEKVMGVTVDAGPTLSAALTALRAIKEPEEVERMRQAQRITDACFTHILPFIKEGVREVDLMLEMEHFMRSHGAEKVAFDTICVAGIKTSLPHGIPGENKVKTGDFITMDFGAKFEGYCADMTRTVALGDPGEEKRKVYDMVLRAHYAGLGAFRAGVHGNEVDKVARDIIYGEGYEGYFGHGLGHAVGIDVHENPRFSPLCSDEILAGMVMTVEPGCYLPGRFGCRIEDMALITPDGCEPMPTSEKDLIIL